MTSQRAGVPHLFVCSSSHLWHQKRFSVVFIFLRHSFHIQFDGGGTKHISRRTGESNSDHFSSDRLHFTLAFWSLTCFDGCPTNTFLFLFFHCGHWASQLCDMGGGWEVGVVEEVAASASSSDGKRDFLSQSSRHPETPKPFHCCRSYRSSSRLC